MTAPFNVQPGPGNQGSGVASVDGAGDLAVAGALTVGGAILLAAQSSAPVPPPGYLVLYTADGQTLSLVAPGGQSAGQTVAGPLTVNGTTTLNGNVNVNLAGAAAALTITNTVQEAFTGSLTMVEAATGSRSIGVKVAADSSDRFVIDATGGFQWGPGNAGRDTFMGRTAAGVVSVTTGSFSVTTAGNGLAVAEGSNAKQGTATLTAGSKVVANTSVTANSRILLTSQADGGTPGWLRVSTRTAGTSFTITSSSGTDTSTVAYEIFEPA